MNSQIGITIKKKRKEKKMTLAELSAKTGFSVSYLSLLERGKNNPTVESLNKVCFALNIMLSELISKMETSPVTVIKKENRANIYRNAGFIYDGATDGNHELSCMVMTVLDNKVHKSSSHITDEIGFVLKGSIMVFVSGKQYMLTEGDCIYIEANCEHGYQKIGDEICECLWFSRTEAHSEAFSQFKDYSGDDA